MRSLKKCCRTWPPVGCPNRRFAAILAARDGSDDALGGGFASDLRLQSNQHEVLDWTNYPLRHLGTARCMRCILHSGRAWCRLPATTCRSNSRPACAMSIFTPARPPHSSTFRIWDRSCFAGNRARPSTRQSSRFHSTIRRCCSQLVGKSIHDMRPARKRQ